MKIKFYIGYTIAILIFIACGKDNTNNSIITQTTSIYSIEQDLLEDLGQGIEGFSSISRLSGATIGTVYEGKVIAITKNNTSCLKDNIIEQEGVLLSSSRQGVLNTKTENLVLLAEVPSIMSKFEEAFDDEDIHKYDITVSLDNVTYRKINNINVYKACFDKTPKATEFVYGEFVGKITIRLKLKNSENEFIIRNLSSIEEAFSTFSSTYTFNKENSSSTNFEFQTSQRIILAVAKTSV